MIVLQFIPVATGDRRCVHSTGVRCSNCQLLALDRMSVKATL